MQGDNHPGNNAPQPDLAIALKYEAGQDVAPRIVASARKKLAEKLLEIAFAHGVKVRKDADLAELLSAFEVGESIPVEAYMAVAEILAYVYAANAEAARGEASGSMG